MVFGRDWPAGMDDCHPTWDVTEPYSCLGSLPAVPSNHNCQHVCSHYANLDPEA